MANPGIIPDSHMTASSTHIESRYQPWFGRLGGNRGDGWCSQTRDSNNDWLQIYFGDMFTVCRVDTQGDINGNEWVTAFKLSFSTNGSVWTTYKSENGIEVVSHLCGDVIADGRNLNFALRIVNKRRLSRTKINDI